MDYRDAEQGAIRVFLADDNLIVREGVRALIERHPDLRVVGVAADYDEVVSGAAATAPQVLVTDIRMPPAFQREGIDAAKEVRKRQPGTGVVVLSQYEDPEYAVSLLAEGSAGYGYLLKDHVAAGNQLADAIRAVATGGTALDPAVVEALVRPVVSPGGLAPAEEDLLSLIAEGKTIKIICVGKKGFDILKRLFEKDILEVVDLRAVKQIGFGNAQTIAQKVLDRFENGEYDVATLFYARFRSVIQQIPTAQRIIPAETDTEEGVPNASGSTNYEFEPDEHEILSSLLPRNVAVQIYRALLENVASEMGAKMSAMDSATRNAGEMIRKQTTLYNRTRQAMITKELIEIISGAEAL